MATTERMTVTKALSELKLLDKRITKLVDDTTFVTHAIGSDPPREARSLAEFGARSKANYQGARDLMRRRAAIKAAVVQSNAGTTLEVAGRTYVVAEAIERKASVAYENRLITRLRTDLARARQEVERENERAKSRLDSQAQALLGKENARGAEYEALYKSFMDRNAPKLVDPLDAQQEVETLERDVDDFLAEVDQALSVSNALTQIDVQY
ncbi:hypothetical protein [Deinococcus hopiensis]|uniref:Uncharacterized protein n=1 Tax=Deinococcus hopiensis KR-140 TaxID=695939 RepID=A0A1W1UMK3_9DEIO|nr:hypothetical protein [Deinococcus hopiensis]SMB82031.1 hypothetical protein SAMN00790413_04820 [Deinococcus hopiensis KR-140]